MHVLLVEDNATDSLLMEHAFARHDPSIVCHTAHTLAEAVAEVERLDGHLDVIVLDLNLPDALGVDALRLLIRTAPLIPIVILTGSEEFESASLHLGARAFKLKVNLDDATFIHELKRIAEEGRETYA